VFCNHARAILLTMHSVERQLNALQPPCDHALPPATVGSSQRG
jgi:hypothetical protein